MPPTDPRPRYDNRVRYMKHRLGSPVLGVQNKRRPAQPKTKHQRQHINYLELLAATLEMKWFAKKKKNKRNTVIHLETNNTTHEGARKTTRDIIKTAFWSTESVFQNLFTIILKQTIPVLVFQCCQSCQQQTNHSSYKFKRLASTCKSLALVCKAASEQHCK